MHISPTSLLPQDRFNNIMKFVIDPDLMHEFFEAISKPLKRNIVDGTYAYVDNLNLGYCEYKIAHNNVNIEKLLSASTRELMRRLIIYTTRLTSVKLTALRNTCIHSLSIFFGLCCSSSGYIFDAITGNSSHPCPVK